MNQVSEYQASGARSIWAILIAWAQGHDPSVQQRQQLIDWELSGPCQVWQILPDSVAIAIESRMALLQTVCRETDPQAFPLPGTWTDWIVPLWRLWLPLAQQLSSQQTALGEPFIKGILGGQGTGKTTLTRVLQLILAQLGHPTVILSIDDLYLTYAQRQQLQQQDPRLIWRGPPGTHDVELGIRTLAQLKSAPPKTYVSVPQFDKSLFRGQGDRTTPSSQLAPNIVLFEGWLVGTRPIADARFTTNPSDLPVPIATPADRQFARDSNRRLQQYLPLWRFLDSLIVMCPQDYRLSQQWRQQAEHKMKAQGKPGLSDPEIAEFVTYFWKALHPELFITPLTCSSTTDLVIEIKADHTPGELYLPKQGPECGPAFGHYDSVHKQTM